MADQRAIALQGAGFGTVQLAVLGIVAQRQDRGRNTSAIAVQGIGFPTRLTALQGLGRDGESTPMPSDPTYGGAATSYRSSRVPQRVRRSRRDELLLIKP